MPSSSLVQSFTRTLFVVLCVLGLGSAPVALAAAPRPATLLVLGDSLSAAYGMRLEQGWVALLQSRLQSQGYGRHVVNASVSGETTGGGLARLPRALETHAPSIVIVELGGNDGLRGLPVADIRRNLEAIVARSQQAGAEVLLLGMRIPPNYGPAYTRGFEQVYTDLARSRHLPIVPFFLAGVALDERLMQPDGIHPNASAQPRLLEAVWKVLEPMLGQGQARTAH